MVNEEQKLNIRLNLALKFGDVKTVEELQSIAEWVVGTESKILPVTGFKVVKN